MPGKHVSKSQTRSKPSPQQEPGVGLSSKDEIIAVLGRAGSGKSTFVQMATSVPQEISTNNSLKAKTTSVNVVRAKSSDGEDNEGARRVIIDTPGVENDILLDQPIFVEVGEKTKTRPPVRIAGIVYFIRVEHHTPPTTISAAFSSINQFRGQFPNRFDKKVVFALWRAGNHPNESRAYSEIQKAVEGERKKRETMNVVTSKDWDMTVESAMAILNEFKHTKISLLQKILVLFKNLLGAKKAQKPTADFVVVIIGSQTSRKAEFVGNLPNAPRKKGKMKPRITTQVEAQRIVIINIDSGPKMEDIVRAFRKRSKKCEPGAILVFRRGSEVGRLEHLEAAFEEIAGVGWREKTKIIDTTPAGQQGKSGEEVGQTGAEQGLLATMRFSGTAQDTLHILRSVMPPSNM
ncbi:hypothetical protein EYR40_002534 [Pleurotus pulmonarius]|nr:hypothetical protein EYR40_002534 [Pleurotus pulmonarius]